MTTIAKSLMNAYQTVTEDWSGKISFKKFKNLLSY